MTQLHLHPSISRARLREALVLAENALYALTFGHGSNGVNQAADTLRLIINEIDRQTNDSSHERSSTHGSNLDSASGVSDLGSESSEVPEAGPAS